MHKVPAVVDQQHHLKSSGKVSSSDLLLIEENNRALHALFDALRDMVLYCDRWGAVRRANLQAHQWWGECLALGRTFVEISTVGCVTDWDDAAERQREILQVARTGQPLLNSREIAAKNGQEHWFSVDKIPTKNDAGQVNGVLLVFSDITEAVRRERAIQESESRYRAYIANSADAIWRYDICPPRGYRFT